MTRAWPVQPEHRQQVHQQQGPQEQRAHRRRESPEHQRPEWREHRQAGGKGGTGARQGLRRGGSHPRNQTNRKPRPAMSNRANNFFISSLPN